MKLGKVQGSPGGQGCCSMEDFSDGETSGHS